MSAKIGTVRVERNRAIQGQKDMRKLNRALTKEIAELRAALQAQQGDAAREQALHAAVAAIYFDDSSDYKSALGTVVRHLDPALAGELLGHPKAAYDKSLARVDAAMLAARREG